MNGLIPDAMAQGAGASPGGQFAPLLMMVVFIAIFYFLLIRPQQKKAKDHRDMIARLKKNDEVMTSGGIYGKVVALTDEVVTLEVASNVRLRVHRPQISTVITVEKSSSKEVKE